MMHKKMLFYVIISALFLSGSLQGMSPLRPPVPQEPRPARHTQSRIVRDVTTRSSSESYEPEWTPGPVFTPMPEPEPGPDPNGNGGESDINTGDGDSNGSGEGSGSVPDTGNNGDGEPDSGIGDGDSNGAGPGNGDGDGNGADSGNGIGDGDGADPGNGNSNGNEPDPEPDPGPVPSPEPFNPEEQSGTFTLTNDGYFERDGALFVPAAGFLSVLQPGDSFRIQSGTVQELLLRGASYTFDNTLAQYQILFIGDVQVSLPADAEFWNFTVDGNLNVHTPPSFQRHHIYPLFPDHGGTIRLNNEIELRGYPVQNLTIRLESGITSFLGQPRMVINASSLDMNFRITSGQFTLCPGYITFHGGSATVTGVMVHPIRIEGGDLNITELN